MKKIKNIYLDIDGVIKNTASPWEDIISFLRYCLDKYQVFWLTTHCRGNENRTDCMLSDALPEELVKELYKKVIPTNWQTLKTEAIDFSTKFCWFDDFILSSERKVLELNLALDSFYKMDPKDPDMAKKALLFLKSM